MFAKLYGTDDDQVLVLLTENDDGAPAISFTAEHEGIRCTTTLSFDDSEAGWDSAEKHFAETINEAVARQIMKKVTGAFHESDYDE